MNLAEFLQKMFGHGIKKTRKEDEFLKCKGSMILTLKKANGDISVTRKDNLILNVGFDHICNSIGATASRPAVMGFTALGTGTTAAAASQTTLVTELARKAAAYSHAAGTKVMTFTTNFAAGEATGAITEAGICNASTGGIFLDRVTFAVINKAADDEVTTTFQFTLS
jgi:hypothetical protein